jgi:ribosome-binding ATPase YchF (GTP1/OBG family)
MCVWCVAHAPPGWKDFEELQDTPGLDKVKAAGKWRQEGKSYVMVDGDICHFQFNVGKKK